MVKRLPTALTRAAPGAGAVAAPRIGLKDRGRFRAALSTRGGMDPLAPEFQSLTATHPGAVRFMARTTISPTT